MSLEFKIITIDGYTNTTDKFGLLVGYILGLLQPLVSGENFAQIVVYNDVADLSEVGINVSDNGLTQTYVQIQDSNADPKVLLIPPGCSLGVNVRNGFVRNYGMLLLGTLDEIARVAIR